MERIAESERVVKNGATGRHQAARSLEVEVYRYVTPRWSAAPQVEGELFAFTVMVRRVGSWGGRRAAWLIVSVVMNGDGRLPEAHGRVNGGMGLRDLAVALRAGLEDMLGEEVRPLPLGLVLELG